MSTKEPTGKPMTATAVEHEWACQWKTFRDGDYDRIVTHNPVSQKPLTKTEAEDMVRDMLAARIPARLIQRDVTPWRVPPEVDVEG